MKNILNAPYIFLFVLFASFVAQPAQAQTYKMQYTVYGSGFEVLTATVRLDFPDHGGDDYRADVTAETHGFLGWMVPWSGRFSTEGQAISTTEMRASMHESVYTWDEETEVTQFTLDKNGHFQEVITIENGQEKERRAVDPDLVDNTTDLLTATLEMLIKDSQEEGVCDMDRLVFDGKRRFTLSFRHKENNYVDSKRYSSYTGPVEICTIEITPKGGKWHEKPRGWLNIQEQGRAKGQLPEIWLARPVEDGPMLPVRVFVKSNYGALIMHLTHAEKIGEVPAQ